MLLIFGLIMSIICARMKITVSTATLKQQLSHYLALAREGKDVLVTKHKHIIARLLSEDGDESRLPLRQPTKDASILKDIGGICAVADPGKEIIKERNSQ